MPTAPLSPAVTLRLENCGKTYQMGEVAVEVLRGVTLEVFDTELLVMVGPSGSGKSTMLNIVGGMDSPTPGRVWYRDEEITADDLSLIHISEPTRPS